MVECNPFGSLPKPPPKGGTPNAFLPPPKGGTPNAFLPPPKGGTPNAFLPPPKGGTPNAFLPPPKGGTPNAFLRFAERADEGQVRIDPPAARTQRDAPGCDRLAAVH